MVKHQCQSHQKLIRSEFDEDEIPESDSDKSLSEAQHSRRMMQPEHIPQHSVMLDKRRVRSFADFAHFIPPTQSPHYQFSQNLQGSPSSYSVASTASAVLQEDAYSLPTKTASLAQQSQNLSLIEQQ
jgi:hypothetical protein